MAAERLLSWYNRRVFLEQREDRNLDFNAVLGDIFEEIRSGLKAKGGNVPHLKMFASGVGEDFFKASLIGVDYPVEYDHKLAAEYSALSVIINARAAAESEAVAARGGRRAGRHCAEVRPARAHLLPGELRHDGGGPRQRRPGLQILSRSEG